MWAIPLAVGKSFAHWNMHHREWNMKEKDPLLFFRRKWYQCTFLALSNQVFVLADWLRTCTELCHCCHTAMEMKKEQKSSCTQLTYFHIRQCAMPDPIHHMLQDLWVTLKDLRVWWVLIPRNFWILKILSIFKKVLQQLLDVAIFCNVMLSSNIEWKHPFCDTKDTLESGRVSFLYLISNRVNKKIALPRESGREGIYPYFFLLRSWCWLSGHWHKRVTFKNPQVFS